MIDYDAYLKEWKELGKSVIPLHTAPYGKLVQVKDGSDTGFFVFDKDGGYTGKSHAYRFAYSILGKMRDSKLW